MERYKGGYKEGIKKLERRGIEGRIEEQGRGGKEEQSQGKGKEGGE